MNGADRLCEVLLANDIDVCFANPGTSEMHFVAALDRNSRMRCVLGLFEGVVTGAADGYGRMKGRPAATLLHTGPGLANGLANLHNARRARTPMLNIVGDHAAYHLGFDAPLTADIDSLARPMSHWVRRIASSDDVGPAVEAAYAAAMSLPGVATLILPADSAWGSVAPAKIRPVGLPARPQVSPDAIHAAAQAVKRTPGRVGILLGGEALRGEPLDIAGAIAESCKARLFTGVLIGRAERGRGRVPATRIPYPIDLALEMLRDIDLLLLIGDTEPVAFFAYPGKPSRLVQDRCQVVALASPGDDLQQALQALAGELGVDRIRRPAVTRTANSETPTGPLTEDAISLMIARHLPDQAILCDEGLTSARRLYALGAEAEPHDYLMNTGGSIGIGIPLATGAAIACPERKVISLQADGSGMYTVQGLWTQARENLNVVTIIFANRAYAILQGELHALGVTETARNAEAMMSLANPELDWVSLAKGMGVGGARATSCETFSDLLTGALKQRGPFLIEAMI
jgi:acetolactate synthase-1/2/3 large subunit